MSWKLKEPTSFSIVKRGDTTFFVKEGYKDAILSMSLDKNFPRIGKKDDTNRKFGRGICLSVPATKNSTERFVVRNYRHGGLLGKLFGGVFYDGNRPLNEVFLNEIAARKGVPSAEVIAIAKRKLWCVFYKADFISKEIPGAVDLVQFLKESSPALIQKSKKSIIFALVRLIRNMHDAGIFHADLHLKNILLKGDTNGEFQAYIIDLDKSVVLKELNIEHRIKNLLRLDRSLEKLRWLSGAIKISQKDVSTFGNPHGFSLSPVELSGKNYSSKISVPQNDWSGERMMHVSMSQKIRLISKADRIRFLKWYMLYNNTLDKDWKRHVRQFHSQHLMHKLWWRVLGLR
ncbi:MAG: lipopolysaccharide kinase InaA family protein [Candidatus Brocadia sp.]